MQKILRIRLCCSDVLIYLGKKRGRRKQNVCFSIASLLRLIFRC
jgi:hypothetical protein